MGQSNKQYSKWRWLLALVGLFMYLGDICTDTALVFRYFREENYVWSGLTALFIITGLSVNQIFSYSWFLEDMHENVMDIKPKRRFLVLHIFGMGILLRSYHLLKQGYKEIWGQAMSHNPNGHLSEDDEEGTSTSHHNKLISDATNLSMLKLFETFLESAPQLLLQLYIHQSHDEWSVVQYMSMVFSFFNLAWSLVDYRVWLRKSLPQSRELPSGLPTVVYLLYKLFTITSLILSYSLLLILSVYSTVGFTSLWLLGTIWAHLLQTDFCQSGVLEQLYRGVVGAILVFTFFNVKKEKGQNTKREMTVYYFLWTVVNFSTPLLLFFLKPELKTITFFWVVSGVIYGGSLLGLISLVSYYRFLHPKQYESDEVDGQEKEMTPSAKRIKRFIKP